MARVSNSDDQSKAFEGQLREMLETVNAQLRHVDVEAISARQRLSGDEAAINSAGTAGTYGSLTGCFGTLGSFGSAGVKDTMRDSSRG